MNTETEAILNRLGTTDPQAAEALRRQFELLSNRREFGLNFRRHFPERGPRTARSWRDAGRIRSRGGCSTPSM